MSYLHEKEAGEFIAHLAGVPLSGAVNGCSKGMISQGDIIGYIEKLTGKKAVLSADGDPAPYNGTFADTSYDTGKAEASGYTFTELDSWVYELIKKIV